MRNRRYAAVSAGILIFAVLLFMTGCGTVQRFRYEMTGGIEEWEQAAAEEGIASGIEEYYYDHLPDSLKETYRELYVRIRRYEDEGNLYSKIKVEDFWTVYYAVLNDHPEIFWVGNRIQAEEFGLTGNVISYQLQTLVLTEDRDRLRSEIEAAADDCIAQIDPEASDYEKIKAVYEYIINTTEYEADSIDSQSVQSALLYKHSVCAGYSRAFQYILHRMGLFCTYITGQIRDQGEHGWNMVRMDGQYYYVDVTWGDPVFAGRVDGSADPVMNYNYLCCTQDDLFQTHVPDPDILLPECHSETYDYYRNHDCFYESFVYDTIYQRLMQSVWDGEASIVLKFGTEEGYEKAQYEMFENGMLSDAGQYLMKINGVTTWNYRYHLDDTFRLITLYWY